MRAARALFAVVALTAFYPASEVAGQVPRGQRFHASKPVRENSVAEVWQDRDISSLNLTYGSGGEANRPQGKFTFVKETDGGSCPKFDVVDERGNHWKAKLGEESQAETAATRLVWAAGYYTDDDYYLPQMNVENLPRLRRGNNFVTRGTVRGVRLERQRSLENSTSWSWRSNAHAGTREMDGLRILMAMLNNWDLKRENNSIYEERGQPVRYVVSDLGATFGRTGDSFTRSKSNLSEYRQTKFIQHIEPDTVDFYLSSRPFFLSVFYFPNYITRTRMQGVAKDIPRAHARWLGQVLGRLSHEQIRNSFRAAGYSDADVDGYTEVIEGRISELNHL